MAPLAVATLAVLVYVHVWWLVSRVTHRLDVADIAWGPGVALVALVALVMTNEPTIPLYVLTGVVWVWALRLAVRIARKNARKNEDPRYAAWRSAWGAWFPLRSYVQVFILQGLLMVVLGYPFVHGSVYGVVDVGVVFIVGLMLWLVGFVFEVVGDAQLDTFLANPDNKGKLMQQGLWRYSRHPNYFGEMTMWWGIALCFITEPYGAVTLVSPLVITFLLTKVSGIPMLEKQLANHPDWPRYKASTSALVPLPPRA